jgi:hypothetical protein
MENVYIPHYHLYPSQPQILHQLVLELFLRAPDYSAKKHRDQFAMVPFGPIYKYGIVLAEARKDIFTGIDADTSLVVIACAEIDGDISAVASDVEALHTWF